MTATITAIPARQGNGYSETVNRRAAALVQLGKDVTDANTSRMAQGEPIKLWDNDETMLAGLLPHTTAEKAREALIEVINWVVKSRADSLSDNEIKGLLGSARQEAITAVLSDTLAAAGAA